MLLKKFDEVIAVREYILGENKKVVLTLGKPALFPKGEGIDGFFYCPFQIVGLDDDRIMCSSGVDSIAAISAALRMAGGVIHYSKSANDGTLAWDGATDNDKFGLPKP